MKKKILTAFTAGQLHVLHFNFLPKGRCQDSLLFRIRKGLRQSLVCVFLRGVYVYAHVEARRKAWRCSLEPPLRQVSLRPEVYYQASLAGQASSLVTQIIFLTFLS